jgi:hypothetical protein
MNCRNKTSQGLKLIPRLMFIILFICAFSLSCQNLSFASTVVLQWEPVTDTNLAGYKVYYQADSSAQPLRGTGAHQGPSPIIIPNPNTETITATISGLDPTHPYYFIVVAYNNSGIESSLSNIVSVPVLASLLSVSLSGNGAGNLNSAPSGITCESGTCVSPIAIGSSLILYATPSSSPTKLSYFSGWTGACNSKSGNSCTVDMTANRSVTASFTSLNPVKIVNGASYTSLQSAYSVATSSNSILAQAVTLSGNFSANSNKTITLNGGFNANYSGTSGYTEMAGTLSLSKGTLIVDKLVIK